MDKDHNLKQPYIWSSVWSNKFKNCLLTFLSKSTCISKVQKFTTHISVILYIHPIAQRNLPIKNLCKPNHLLDFRN